MNDLLKLLSKSLKPYGYHIRPVGGMNLLRIRNVSGYGPKCEESLKPALHAQNRTSGNFSPDLSHMSIYLRSCLRHDRNIDARPRITGSSVSDTAFACIHSLVASINYAAAKMKSKGITLRLVVMDDHSDPDLWDKIQAITKEATCELIHRPLQDSEKGQGPSLLAQFETARTQDRGLCYFVEDDYLHEEEAIWQLYQFYRRISEDLGTHNVLYPQEHPVLYGDYYPSYILAGEDRHWRTMRHATHTFMTHSDIVRQYWDYFKNTRYIGNRKKRRKGSEAKTTNRLFKKIPGFSPLRPLAVHLQFAQTLPPLYDWQTLWRRHRI